MHNWKDEKRPREYGFDAVFGPGANQDTVRGSTQRRQQWKLEGHMLAFKGVDTSNALRDRFRFHRTLLTGCPVTALIMPRSRDHV